MKQGGGGGGGVYKKTVMVAVVGGVKHKDLFLSADLRVLYIPNSRISTPKRQFLNLSMGANLKNKKLYIVFIVKNKKMAVCSLLTDRFLKVESPFYTNDVKTPAQSRARKNNLPRSV